MVYSIQQYCVFRNTFTFFFFGQKLDDAVKFSFFGNCGLWSVVFQALLKL